VTSAFITLFNSKYLSEMVRYSWSYLWIGGKLDCLLEFLPSPTLHLSLDQ